eukprot:CAMPEP_0177369982 /NCGR_PEP_ID=MMETSP0368-20130122/41740_1 /TAXON_ID=447022 ORGANISM="Scrippsiella hangoei-like, Strain SHHI-4" /NCGR_SAMPLE_ID=MMETSP0368 /ASSEMBLY_ACC=CAM_ASM_000363 /LENGTH=65 /DNA_ID=CAMNT_0018833199 /DNA_START=212 /DNA_END=409 /DNA_ORIENTATION=-
MSTLHSVASFTTCCIIWAFIGSSPAASLPSAPKDRKTSIPVMLRCLSGCASQGKANSPSTSFSAA